MEVKPQLDAAEGQEKCSRIRQIHTEHGLNQKRDEKLLDFPTDPLLAETTHPSLAEARPCQMMHRIPLNPWHNVGVLQIQVPTAG